MQPYYESDGVTIYNGDCLDVMRELPDNSIDSVITDPPYLVTDLSFDDSLNRAWVTELLRIVKDDGYLCSFGLEVIQNMILCAGWVCRFSGVWLKEKGGMRTHSAKKPMCQQELFKVYAHPKHTIKNLTWNNVYRDGEPYKKVQHNLGYNRNGKDQLDRANTSSWTNEGYVSENKGTRLMTDVLYGRSKGSMKHAERTSHPTQKPLEVITTQVLWLTNPGDTVLDPFMGSGTTGIACILEGRQFIGIDMNAEYCEIAKQRIAYHQEQARQLALIPT